MTNIHVSSSGEQILTTSYDRTAKVWSIDNNEEPLRILEGHRNVVYNGMFSNDDSKVITVSFDKKARVYCNLSGE